MGTGCHQRRGWALFADSKFGGASKTEDFAAFVVNDNVFQWISDFCAAHHRTVFPRQLPDMKIMLEVWSVSYPTAVPHGGKTNDCCCSILIESMKIDPGNISIQVNVTPTKENRQRRKCGFGADFFSSGWYSRPSGLLSCSGARGQGYRTTARFAHCIQCCAHCRS